ncbi:MAG: ankyrin repeat domain-containing protein [Proteobacteria bacterium]|nr:ankyrin repeat domain-containing protein [Pseudomonadota bacterium]
MTSYGNPAKRLLMVTCLLAGILPVGCQKHGEDALPADSIEKPVATPSETDQAKPDEMGNTDVVAQEQDAPQAVVEPLPEVVENLPEKDLILENILKCEPCFKSEDQNCTAGDADSSDDCYEIMSKVEWLSKDIGYLNRFFKDNQEIFDRRLSALQEEMRECAGEWENRDTYSAADMPPCDNAVFSILTTLESEKKDAAWLKAHGLPDAYRKLYIKVIEYHGPMEYGADNYYGHFWKNESGTIDLRYMEYEDANMDAAVKAMREIVAQGVDINKRVAEDEPNNLLFKPYIFRIDNKDFLLKLIEAGMVDPNAQDENGNTLLAVHGLKPKLVDALIQSGADVSIANHDGICAFFRMDASMRKNWIWKSLDVSKVKDKDGNTPLHLYADDINILKVLIKSGLSLEQKNNEGRTPVFYAKSPDVLKAFMDAGADLKARDNHQNSLLHASHSPEMLAILLAQGLDVNIKNDLGQTPVFFANTAETLAIYIAHGADVNIRDSQGNGLLHSNRVDSEMISTLLKADIHINDKNDMGQTPLFFVDINQLETLRAYINSGADVNVADRDGNTIIHHKLLSDEAWDILLKAGFNQNARNNQQIPAWFASYKLEIQKEAKSYDYDGVKILKKYLDRGADVHVTDDEGNTLLHGMIKCGKQDNDKAIYCYGDDSFSETYPEIIPRLVNAGLDVNQKNHEGKTPIFGCIPAENSEDIEMKLDDACFEQFKKLGADIYALDHAGNNLLTECIRQGCVSYELLLKNEFDTKTPEPTRARALELYKGEVPERTGTCRGTSLYDPVDASLDEYCESYSGDQLILPLMAEWGLELNGDILCTLGAPCLKKELVTQAIRDAVNAPNCVESGTLINQKAFPGSLECYLNDGGDINASNGLGNTPLMTNAMGFYGTDMGPVDCIDIDRIMLFVEAGADINHKNRNGNTILYFSFGTDFIADEYCNGAHCDYSDGCDINIVSYLIKHGANVNNMNHAHVTPLMHHIQYLSDLNNYEDNIKALLQAGAEVNAKDKNGKTALMYAADSGNDETIKALLQAGAEVNAKDKNGKTALMYAASTGNEDAIEALVKAGADLSASDNKGKTVKACAAESRNEDAAKLLERLESADKATGRAEADQALPVSP